MFLRHLMLKSFKNCKQAAKLKSTNLRTKVALPVSLNVAAISANNWTNNSADELIKKVVSFLYVYLNTVTYHLRTLF